MVCVVWVVLFVGLAWGRVGLFLLVVALMIVLCLLVNYLVLLLIDGFDCLRVICGL